MKGGRALRSIDIPSVTKPHSRRAFVRHFFEMLVAMVAGMAVLGAAVTLLLTLLGCASLLEEHVDLHAVVMATNMTVGMGVWMRHRHHDWSDIREMSAAMYLPFLVLLAPYWSGVLGGGGLLTGGHLLMLPAMLGVMLYRWDVYAHDHHLHAELRDEEMPVR
jgi:flagellar biosynthetic protein FliP